MPEKQHIIIADDEEFLCVTVADFLRDAQYEVSIVHDGTGVLPLLEKGKVDLVLLDLMMPRMGGFETLAVIREKSPETRVIILSAYGAGESVRQAEREGADAFINKPFGIETLMARIKDVLSGSSNRPFHEREIE